MQLQTSEINREKLAYFEPIKVTSPEQFVPLYLVQETPFNYDYTRYVLARQDNGVLVPSSLRSNTTNRSAFKETLVNQLNHSYPSEYRFGIPNQSQNYGAHNYHSYIITDFVGKSIQTYWRDLITRLGLLVRPAKTQFNLSYNTVKVDQLYQVIYTSVPTPRILPDILIVVKAKHIPALRAAYYLNIPHTIPLGDMKMLLSENTSGSQTVGRFVLNSTSVAEFIKVKQPIIEHTTSEEIAKYLIPDVSVYNKDVKQCIQAALAVAEEELVEV